MKTSASWLMVDVKVNAGNMVTHASICHPFWKVWRLDNTFNSPGIFSHAQSTSHGFISAWQISQLEPSDLNLNKLSEEQSSFDFLFSVNSRHGMIVRVDARGHFPNVTV